MKNKILLYVVIILSLIYINIGSKKEVTSNFLLSEKVTNDVSVVLKDLSTSNYYNLDMEDYIIGVVAGEMPASFETEALKAQAVAARTYAYYKMKNSNGDYDLTTDASTQVYLTKEKMIDKWGSDYEYYYDIISDAVNSTSGQILTYDGSIICAYYFAMGNGLTEDSTYAFSEKMDYLVSVNSYDSEEDKNFSYNYEFTKEEFLNKLGLGGNDVNISNIVKSDSSRVVSIMINNEQFSGTSVRHKLDLRSNDFEITVSDKIYITTRGFGHGVGMSQYGANNMAKLGYSYEEILKHFYTNTNIENIGSII